MSNLLLFYATAYLNNYVNLLYKGGLYQYQYQNVTLNCQSLVSCYCCQMSVQSLWYNCFDVVLEAVQVVVWKVGEWVIEVGWVGVHFRKAAWMNVSLTEWLSDQTDESKYILLNIPVIAMHKLQKNILFLLVS